jgi:hypothetical protein
MNIELIKGKDLTQERKEMLKFKGMKNPEWVENHEFYFIDGKPADVNSGYYYPVCKSLSHLPY